MTGANFKKFFNYQLVNIRNVSNENFNICVNSMNKSGSHCQNSDVDKYNSDWGKMRLQICFQITNVCSTNNFNETEVDDNAHE